MEERKVYCFCPLVLYTMRCLKNMTAAYRHGKIFIVLYCIIVHKDNNHTINYLVLRHFFDLYRLSSVCCKK
jgi:Zn-finger protein